ncbi:MAG TPA: two-component regulator propeller domain-containing protein [Chitinophagaceae bacterium]|nr:two-component regulator propeller domain-containing protein [Chitinophagaceae bacterium]
MLRIGSLLILLLVFAKVQAQNTVALPEIVNYTKQAYNAGPANWSITQDKKGIIYVANDEGLLTFDGSFWKQYSTHNASTIRSLALAPDGRVYVGSSGEIGYFEPGKNGVLHYTSLNNLIPETEKDFTEVWNVVVHGEAIFFRSFKRLFEYRNNKITVYRDIAWSFLGASNGRLISKAFGKGLLQFQDGRWVPFIQGDTLAEKAQVVALLPLGKDSSLLITKKHGTYILNNNRLLPFTVPDVQAISAQNPYGASFIDNERIAVVTSLAGCFIINKQGHIIQRLAKQDGLQNNDILCVFVDRDKNLWLGLASGIDFIAYNNAIKHIYPDYEEQSGGKSAIIYNNTLYIGTSNGLYHAPIAPAKDLSYVKSSFEAVPNTRGQVWTLTEVNGELLMGHNDGFFVIKNNVPQVVDGNTGFWTFLPLSNILPSPLLLAGTYNGVNVYTYENGVFKNPNIHTHFESARFIALDNNVAWVAHPYKGLYKIQLNNGVQLTYAIYQDRKTILAENKNHIFKIKSRIVFTGPKGLYEYDDKTDDFVPSTLLRNIFGNMPVEYLKEDGDGRIWFVENKRLGVVDFSKGSPQIIRFPELNNKIMAGGFEFVYPYDANNIFVAAEEGFYHINYEQYHTVKNKIPMLLAGVRINHKRDSTILGGHAGVGANHAVAIETPEIDYGWNTIHFEYSSPLYGKQSSIEYSCMLEGFDKNWMPWSKKTEKDYAYLPPGNYIFKAKARTHEGEESAVITYRFTILPPWYKTIWAYLVYALLAAAMVYAAHRFQKRKFIAQQLKHEEERKKLEYLNKLQKEKFEEEQKQLMYLHQLEIERSEKEIIRLQNEKLESEIELKNTQLASTTLNLIQKGEMLVKVKEEFERMKRVSDVDKDSDDYKKILKMLGDDKMKKNWEQFAVHFDKVHSDFLVSIKEAYPNLTPSELKLCAYLRLSLSSKEIAQIMNITIKSVELGRHRLRKKLGIDPNVNLFNFLLNFHSEVRISKNGH